VSSSTDATADRVINSIREETFFTEFEPRLVIGVGKFAKASLLRIYPEARELTWPFRVPYARRSDLPGVPHLLFPPHPYWIMTRPADVRELLRAQTGPSDRVGLCDGRR
jgi:hypothetical protein